MQVWKHQFIGSHHIQCINSVAVEFLNGEDSSLDTTHARYKIRMGADTVPQTYKTQPK